jgi:hypothetical protein
VTGGVEKVVHCVDDGVDGSTLVEVKAIIVFAVRGVVEGKCVEVDEGIGYVGPLINNDGRCDLRRRVCVRKNTRAARRLHTCSGYDEKHETCPGKSGASLCSCRGGPPRTRSTHHRHLLEARVHQLSLCMQAENESKSTHQTKG